MPKSNPLRTLRVSFIDERIKPVSKRLDSDGDCCTGEVALRLPGGEKVSVYAEVFEPNAERRDADVAITIEGNEATWCSVRCTSGVIVSYVTPGGIEIHAQVGTGPWE